MSAPGLQDGSAERLDQAATAVTARLSTAVSASAAAAALAAIAAAKASTGAAVAEPPPQIGHFLDELSRIVSGPITLHQREQLTTALIEAIDARVTVLLP